MPLQEHNASALSAPGVSEHWWLFLIEGIVLILLGVGAVIIPAVASLAAAIFLGWLFLVGGFVGLVTTLSGRRAPGFWWALLSAAVTIIAGLLLVGWPLSGAISLTLVLTAYLLLEGFFMILYAVEHRRQLTHRWGFMLFNGVLDLILAGVIIVVLPVGALWVLGLFIGIDFIFGGSALVAVALAARKHARPGAAPGG